MPIRGESDLAEGRVIQECIITRETGKAFEVMKGQILRIIEGPQIGDLNAFNLHDFGERFSAGRTRSLHSIHIQKGDKLWSNPGRDHVMFTILEDTVEHKPGRYGARAHDLLFPRCSRLWFEKVWGVRDYHPNCQDNLAEAIKPYGLSSDDVHDAFNFFMKTGVDDAGNPFIEPPDSEKGDHIDLLAEIDCLVALSACPVEYESGGKTKTLKVQILDGI
jgi:uncharacterized protein YcgI (DUF1989 family)